MHGEKKDLNVQQTLWQHTYVNGAVHTLDHSQLHRRDPNDPMPDNSREG